MKLATNVKYLPREWTLLMRLSGSVVRGQVYIPNAYGGIHFNGLANRAVNGF